jgi:hypothetical protein
LAFMSYNLVGNFGGHLEAFLGLVKKTIDENLNDRISKTFVVALGILASLNLLLFGLLILFLRKINTVIVECFESYKFMRPHEIFIQREYWNRILQLMTLYKYNEKVLINEFVEQRVEAKRITAGVEVKMRASIKRSRTTLDLVQNQYFNSHIKIYSRLLFTFLLFLLYILMSITV